MQRIYLLARAARQKDDPETWLANLFAAQTSTYERAQILMAGRLALSRALTVPQVADHAQIVALLKIWQAEMPALPEDKVTQAVRQTKRRARETWDDFKERVKSDQKARQKQSKARQKAEREFAALRTPKGLVAPYDEIVPASDFARREAAEQRKHDGKVYIGPRRIRETPVPNPRANGHPLHWREAV